MENLDCPIENLEFSTNILNCLKNANISTIEDLTKKTEDELLSIPNLGKKSVAKIKEKLQELNSTLQSSDNNSQNQEIEESVSEEEPTPAEEPPVSEDIPSPVEDIASTEETPAPAEEPPISEDIPSPVEDIASTEETPAPAKETSVSEEEPTPVEESPITETSSPLENSTPVENTPSSEKKSSPLNNFQIGGKTFGIITLAAIIVTLFTCLSVFFMNVKGPEEVMVPEVRGKELAKALIEMQNKELYPKITLRYSDVPGDEGTILDQSPEAGTIVKGYSRVSLVVSRGVVVDHVENYVGMNFDDLKMKLQTLFAGSTRPLILLASPVYKANVAEAGTILEQNPPEGTEISQPVTVKLVVSSGPNFENTRVPRLVGLSLEKMVSQAANSKLIYDFTSHVAAQDEQPGSVTEQQKFDSEFIRNYSRMTVDMAMPVNVYNGKKYGIFSAELSKYPYPVPMRLEASSNDGPVVLVNLLHSGGSFTMPYAVEPNTTITLYVVDKAAAKITVH